MLFTKPVKNDFQAKQKYARLAQDLIQCWKSMDKDSRCSAVANLNKKYGTHLDMFDHDLFIVGLKQKLNGDYKKFL
jgi:hypothetical protein